MATSQSISPNGFNTLLVAADLSPKSRKALSCAVSLARKSHARILVAHVTNPGLPSLVGPDEINPVLCTEHKKTQKKLAHLLTCERLQGLEIDTVIKSGAIASTLRDIAHQRHADLILAAIQGRKGVSKLLFGSTAQAVCQHAPCPIMLLGPHVNKLDNNFERLMYATDLSPQSLGALPLFLAFASQCRSRIKIVRIVAQMNGDREFVLEQAKCEILPAITSRAGLAHPPEFEVRCGSAGEQILQAAIEWPADTIGIGASRPGTLAMYLSGDLAYDVACDAHCPVLTVID